MRHVLFCCAVIGTVFSVAMIAKEFAIRSKAASSFLIKGGTVIDGTGCAGIRADVLISDGRIVSTVAHDLDPGTGIPVIDATGLVVTPGFIDTHAHGDPLKTPEFANFLAMGVTTICLGQDGESQKSAEMDEWMNRVEKARLGPNVATMVGHATVRQESGIAFKVDPSPTEMARMMRCVDTGLKAGAFGLTTGLEYEPGSFSKSDELAAIARVVGQHKGLIQSHMRSEDDDRIETSIQELVEQGRAGRCRVQISHWKAVYGKGQERGSKIRDIVAVARQTGVDLRADLYPYAASYTGIGIVFPDFAKAPHDYQKVKERRRNDLRDFLRKRVLLRNGPEATLFGSGPYAGKTLKEVADAQGKLFEDVLLDIGPDGASAAYFVMDEKLQETLLQDSFVNVCSDGSPTMRHPRGYGSFAKIIRKFVTEDRSLSLEEAIRRMTSLAAETLGLLDQKRGLLKEGFAADVLVFDPKRVRDKATFLEPHRLAEGFDTVLVNGVLVRTGGQFTNQRAGRMIRRQRGQR